MIGCRIYGRYNPSLSIIVSSPNWFVVVVVSTETLRWLSGGDEEDDIMLGSGLGRRILIGKAGPESLLPQ
jgi:hypothetical protein